ncbi:MAG: hypothetical protein A3G47_00375 [Candidatus Zambryskibacteria bacterium RIFCSPLOWO2_12_FULL_39_45]|uniref:Uncharacterized protein n=2 Tax=Candidatus Zambryskiibacteriota TaxID=1817925 RepID=A0A1G2T745_9BACT|nr:MAG: hypothetical protein A2W58_03415 [Candidatus Zambryskibacteria bacterium RIFCSPHIGHO2_02_38_10.5]OHA95684.1 MAG: hypothetical protein A3C63_00385 [Candidatus Zambryskibacteria bacterium RIFCSPHIGHO2_02_FULL_39_82]OHA98592.1 MAG: hypothetical protein A3E32_03580 [Candidatus Zambryskibacteria bacterium RIFCSPHIGHO2_12_FULL_38_37]OHB09208.1 MAG: hypothetical protein A2W64_01550 [Candidatus Zambryskibacteria bacterium RIFCSPLOWO2_02_39_10]OHB10667.1 MAG: hypothetical protein A3I21_00675 [Ca
MWSYNKKNNRGMALIEIVIGASIISVGILAISTAYNTYVQHAFANEKNIQAAYILEEGLEAVTLLRDKGWNANIKLLSTTTTYYLTLVPTYWATTTTPQYIDGTFLRNIAITDVKRDLNDRIATAGTYDPNTKLVTATVSYFQGHGTTTRSLSTYIANIYNN